MNPVASDRWSRLRAHTPARIGLGRAGDALTATDLLDFQFACAEARDAVHAGLEMTLPDAPVLHSAARDRAEYLRRPDLGRRLSAADAAMLKPDPCDLVFVVCDGLSARAVEAHAAGVIAACATRLGGWTTRTVVVRQGRVAVGDEVGVLIGARLVVVLIGERPGLSVPDSLGAYLTWAPEIGRRDSERNCVSNIHARGGLSHDAAADRIVWLAREAGSIGATGVALKDRSGEALLGG